MKVFQQLSWFALFFIMVITACSTVSPPQLIDREDHSGLATWYEQEAVRLRGKAEEMQQMIDRYAAFSAPHLSPKETKADLIAHCRDFMHYYTKAAEEAETLAKLHRGQTTVIP